MRRILIACAAFGLCISPALAGPKEAPKETPKENHKAGMKACSTCKEIEKSGEGWCDHDKSGMVNHIMVKDAKVYKAMKDSSYAKALDSGAAVKASEIKCPTCKKNAEAHKDGFCKKCDGGLVMGHFFKGKASYDKAEHALVVMKDASKSKCEGCGVAMVSDGTCSHCKVSYKDGKKVKA